MDERFKANFGAFGGGRNAIDQVRREFYAAGMTRSILIYATVLAAATFGLQWFEYRHFTKAFATEIYIVFLVAGFLALGIWVGRMLTPQSRSAGFSLNQAALNALGITKREHAVLTELARGQSNKAIARALNVSPNTVKSHVARLYEKLEVGQRVQAVQKAKDLQLVP